MVSFDNFQEKDLAKLKKFGFRYVKPKTIHEARRMEGSCSLVLYKTNKLLLQGKNEGVKEVEKLIRYLGLIKDGRKVYGYAIGTDETLKGDTFGGLVVCGFIADEEIREQLKKYDVRDSKSLSNPQVVKIATKLQANFPENYHVEALYPEDYNTLNKKESVTVMLNELHKKCFLKLRLKKTKVVHIVDQYPGANVGDILVTKAEEKYIEVAAASIIARFEALKQIQELEQQAGFFIPMGSTHVEGALLELRKKSLDPKKYVKMNFKNVQKML